MPTSVSRSLTISLAERYLSIGLRMLSFFALARLLTPEEIGIFSVAVAVIGVAQILRDFGIGSYLIQEVELTEARIRTAFTITLIISLLLFSVVLMAAGPVAAYYKDVRLAQVLQLLSINFLLVPFNSTTLSILKRDMKFGILAWFSVSSAVTGTATALIFAAAGAGYNALVYSSIASTLTLVLGGAIYRGREFVLRPTLSEWRRIMSFGGQVAFTNVLGHISMNMNDLVVGRVLGFPAVAIISRAQGVMNIFHRDMMGAIRRVAYPAFAQAHRAGADLESIHTRSITAATAVAWPFYGFFVLYPLESLRFLFGDQWDAAAPLVPVFCLAGAVAVVWSLSMNLVTAMGHVGLATRSALVVQPLRIILLLFCAYYYDTLMPFAVTLLIVYTFQVGNSLWLKNKVLPTKWPEFTSGLGTSAILTGISLAPAIMVRIYLDSTATAPSEYILMPALAAVTFATWVFALRLIRHPALHDPIFPDRIRSLIIHPFRMPS